MTVYATGGPVSAGQVYRVGAECEPPPIARPLPSRREAEMTVKVRLEFPPEALETMRRLAEQLTTVADRLAAIAAPVGE